MCHPHVVWVDLDELGPQLAETALQFLDHSARIVGGDKSDTHKPFGPFSDVLGYQIVAPVGIAVEDAVEACHIDAGIVHTAQIDIGIV